MSHFSDHPRLAQQTQAAIESVRQQTDNDWLLVIVDDVSPEPAGVAVVEAAAEADPDRIVLLRNETNLGQGAARNRGVVEAHRRGCDFVMHLDCDDLAHPRRVEVTREVFAAQPDVVFIYSPFIVIDEQGTEWEREKLTPSIVEILEQFDREPLAGADCWLRMAIDTGYVSLTSTVSARTSTMLRYPFPARARGAEDAHCWIRIFAGDGLVHFEPSIPSKYRIPSGEIGSSERARHGGDSYYRLVVNAYRQMYTHVLLASLKRGATPPSDAGDIYVAALRRLETMMNGEGQAELVAEIADEIDMLTRALGGPEAG
ncbi:glycosyltransferase family A protein [Actinoplanes sp. N902-109]|uniref:glycosyltransferase family A protein n=1 Tax=Actinoplanes sp. (strain N902-109) TaxID=649831 RepID=UPI00032938C3|nr:glycosyltransferase family A protein [Actinoplanes sp. N902-109]AGL16368.1 glycosyl transferase family 2 [Actinoplanes sp. N902-109]